VHRLNAIRWEHWSEGGEVDVLNEQSYDMDENGKSCLTGTFLVRSF